MALMSLTAGSYVSFPWSSLQCSRTSLAGMVPGRNLQLQACQQHMSQTWLSPRALHANICVRKSKSPSNRDSRTVSRVGHAFLMLALSSLAGGDIVCLANAIGPLMLPSGQKGCRHGHSLCVHPPVPPSAAAHLQGRRQACFDCFCPQPHCSSWGLAPPLTPATMHVLSKDLGEYQ